MSDLIVDALICKDTDIDRDFLVGLRSNNRLGKNIGIVYVYSLVGDELINYPMKRGNIVYIGQAKRKTEPTGIRFGQHISIEACRGGDTGINYTLTRYYWKGLALRLRIFQRENCKETENDLLMWHMINFGAYPIAQGAGGITVNRASQFVAQKDTKKILEYLKI